MSPHLQIAPGSPGSPAAQDGSLAVENAPIRVVLADDHAMMLRSLQMVLEGERNIQVIAEASDLASVTRHVGDGHPDVLVLDLSLPDGSSLHAIGELREQAPDTQIVVLTMDENPVFAQRALGAGALGYILKELADQELAQAVRAAARGEEYVSPRLAKRLQSLNSSLTDDRRSVTPAWKSRASSTSPRARSRPTARTSTPSSGLAAARSSSATRCDAGCSAPERERYVVFPGTATAFRGLHARAAGVSCAP
jgi:DNA-binding NarL/FixJ family response regulator